MFNKYLWIHFVELCAFISTVAGLSEQKLKYAVVKPTDFDVKLLPKVSEEVVRNALKAGKRNFEEEAKFNAVAHPVIKRSYTFNRVSKGAWKIFNQSEIASRAADILSIQLNLTKEASNALVKNSVKDDSVKYNLLCEPQKFNCNSSAKYRSMNGSCNNLKNPYWGMTLRKMNRLLKPNYGDGYNSPRISKSGKALPLARTLSIKILPDIQDENKNITYLIMHFGQMLLHDILLTSSRTDLTNCCNNRNSTDCFPMMLPKNDPQFGPLGIRCMEFFRSIRACGNGVREHIDQQTAFLDASFVYGSTDDESAKLRTFQHGLMQISDSESNSNLPLYPNDRLCAPNEPDEARNYCFVSGDNRVNTHPGLIATQTLFLREHNRIARIFQSMFPNYSDEMIFQETRRIVFAELESIIYNEYLPIIIGPGLITQFNLSLPKDGRATSYDSNIDSSVLNSFVAAAFRYGHSEVQNLGFIGNSGDKFELKDNYENPTLIHKYGIGAILVGSLYQRPNKVDNYLAEAITKFLFRPNNRSFGFDLGALSIQRGRDHGLPSYNEFRKFCDFSKVNSFDELHKIFSHPSFVKAFRDNYEHVDDIDLYLAGISEIPVPGGLVGPTVACIIGIQFYRLLYGDRYFYTHGNQSGSFTRDERVAISNRTLASLMCDNLNIDSIQLKAFVVPSKRNPVVSCKRQPKINFKTFTTL